MAEESTPQADFDFSQIIAESQPMRVDYRALGGTGLRNAGGVINESSLKGLSGRRAAQVFKEMGDNDPSLGIIEFMIHNIVRSVSWVTRPASDDPKDLEAADFIKTCMNDMDRPWDDYIDEHLSMIRYGYSLHEICYKRRVGRSPEPWLRSKYQDGRIGWRGIPIRAQETIERWVFDSSGALTGVVQLDPYSASIVEIPAQKFLLFRTRSYKNNPEGQSAYSRAYRPWHFKKNIEESEAMGVQRDLAGLPIVYMPPEMMTTKNQANPRSIYNSFKKIVTQVRRDELEGVLMPLAYDEKGNKLFDFTLMQSGGTRQHDTSKIIERLDAQIFRTALADFLTLGQGQNSSGSWAMHSDKTQIFLLSLKAYLSQIKNVYNLHAIPRLLELNGMEVTDYPQIDHTPLEQVDMKTISESISSLAMAGMPLFPNPEIERRLLEILGLPTPTDSDREQRERQNIPVRSSDPNTELEEIHPDTPKEAPKPAKLPGQTAARPIFREEALAQVQNRFLGKKK